MLQKFNSRKTVVWVNVIIMLICLFAGTFLAFVVHELSHLLTLIMVNGSLADINVGTLSYVAGYVPMDYISSVAISSLLYPTILIALFSLINNKCVGSALIGIVMHNILNAAFGIFAAIFINQNRNEWDVAMAIDYSQSDWIIWGLVIICLIINLTVMIKLIKRIVQTF